MLISNSRKFIFLHIPKTAGTSLTNALAKSTQWNDVVIGGTVFGESVEWYYRDTFNLDKHSSARKTQSVVGQDIWDEYFKFTFVRHPYTRAISTYTYIQRMAQIKNLKGCIKAILGTHGIRQWPITKAYLATNNFSDFIRHEKFKTAFFAASQTKYLIDDSKKINLDFIGKLENLNEDFSKISNKIELGKADLEKKNISKKSFFLKKPSLVESDYIYLQELYKEDFDNFDYDPSLRL
ncbi:MAG: sulfotransferase family protein [Leptolyngbya sp. SIO3F4]|nr:sulfotransferase family protein [Leptolyngbya sp. SIO3F4]